MNKVFPLIEQYLQNSELNYSIETEKNTIRFGMKGKVLNLTNYVAVNEENNFMICQTFLDFTVPLERRKELAVFVCRLNSGFMFGGFHINFEDGYVCFRTFLPTDENTSMDSIDRLVRGCLHRADEYSLELLEFIFGKQHSEKNIKPIQNRNNQSYEISNKPICNN